MPPAPHRHSAFESAWARRTRAEREQARRAKAPSTDVPTAEINAESYEQPTADVDPAAPVKPTFVSAAPVAGPTAATNVAAAHIDAASEPRSREQEAEPGIESEAAHLAAPLASDRVSTPALASAAPASIPAPFAPSVDAPAAPALNQAERSQPVAREITTGSVLNGRYLLGRLLGSGGGALIFQAEDRRRIGAEDFGSKIAIKVLRPEARQNAHAITRLKREFRQMQRLSHPGIARVFEIDCDEDVWFMTMELIDGQTINQWLRTSTSRAAGLQIIAGCAEALTHAHEAGVIHGDLKPSNVLVLGSGDVKLVDFGSAAERDVATGEVDKERSFAATPPYASPQVLAGEIADPRDDVFSLACLAYAVLTQGEHPFDRKSSAEAQQAQMKPAYSRALLPRQFDVLVRALSWEREQRPATVREFWHALLASDLRREAARDSSIPVDSASHPIPSAPLPSTPTRDAPTVAASQLEAKPASAAPPSTAAAASKQRPSQQRETIKHEDIVRLKAAIAAAETHAERLEQQEPRQTKEEPLTKFRGYVAGPMAQRDDVSEDIPAGLAADSSREPSKKPSKRIWPWQRFAWLLVIGAASAVSMIATRLDVPAAATAESQTLPRPPPATSTPAPAPANAAISEPTPLVEKQESPQIAAARVAPAARSEVSFTTRTLQVGVGQTMAALAVKRLHSTSGRARVAWTIEGGTARPGIDYRVGDTQIIEFLEGQSVRSLFIPLVPEKDAGDARASKTFTVKLQSTDGGPKLGEIKQVYVTIVGDVAAVEHLARTD